MVFLIVVAGIHLRTLHTSSVDKAFESQYKSLVVITLAFVTMGAATLSTLIFETAMGRNIITQSGYAKAGALLPPYIYIVFGLPLSFFLLAKSFKNDPRLAQRRRARSAASEGKSSYGQFSFVIPTHKRAVSAYATTPGGAHPLSTPSPPVPYPYDGGGGGGAAPPGQWQPAPARGPSSPNNFVYPPPGTFVRPPESVVNFNEREHQYAGDDREEQKWHRVKGWFRSTK